MYQAIIVDDEKMIINSLALGFDWKASGFEIVATATNSTQALEMIQFIRPDIVFTDIKMPGISGIELMQRVHQTLPQIKFVVISGYSDFSFAQQAIQVGALAYCLKPLENEDIAAVLMQAKTTLDNAQAIIQASFMKLLWQPTLHTTEQFLSLLYQEGDRNSPFCVAISVGSAQFLLSGNVCYTYVEVSKDCYFYLISSNAKYLDSSSFQTALLSAAAEKKVRAFAYQHTASVTEYLYRELPSLFDSVYAYFICPNYVTLGAAESIPIPKNAAPSALIEQIALAANKNKIAEVLDLFSGFNPALCSALRCRHAVKLYHICIQLLSRLKNEPTALQLNYIFELVEHFDNFEEMLQFLINQLYEQNNGNVLLDSIHNETLTAVLQYVHLNYAKPLKFQKICADYNISASYLSQLFKKELGTNFMNYLYTLRLNYAKELLSTTNLRVQEIGERVGFDYYYNFSKLFKREIGMTPKQYRETQHGKAASSTEHTE